MSTVSHELRTETFLISEFFDMIIPEQIVNASGTSSTVEEVATKITDLKAKTIEKETAITFGIDPLRESVGLRSNLDVGRVPIMSGGGRARNEILRILSEHLGYNGELTRPDYKVESRLCTIGTSLGDDPPEIEVVTFYHPLPLGKAITDQQGRIWKPAFYRSIPINPTKALPGISGLAYVRI